ncbi:MAG: amidohydrolase [Syntrophobacterales bacterium]|nr:amidohydrolase [Syntrophobacterales bacterium]
MVLIIDAHVHCGIQDTFPPQDVNTYRRSCRETPIGGAVMFPPVAEVYDRYDPSFVDSLWWRDRRRKAHEYLLGLAFSIKDFVVYPFLFVWNDFAWKELERGFRGIKWHRHPEEPRYHYSDPRCALMIDEIRRRALPVILEEEFTETVSFIKERARGVTIIIPHLGLLNGGYNLIKREGLWDLPNVYADTALADVSTIKDYIRYYGTERLIFGSDFPFGDPKRELRKIIELKEISEEERERILGGNILRIIG